jgi:phenylpropionate dioxygenase-like ring-hydroxylating dioxygenase large terminal subunit
MTIERSGSFDFHQFVDRKAGTVARQIFGDEEIYRLELERIFARAWNFMCHESQIPNAGDFFLSFIGEESVICVRDKTGGFRVFLNSCRHRGNAVCRAEQGNTRSFLCTYHGWTYDLQGKLIGVPGYKDLYHEQLDRSQWGLIRAGKVAAYEGFVFATMDPDAPDLEEFLGPVGRLGIDYVASRGEMVAFQGVQKNQIGCNWKLAADNIFDWYHVDISHASALQAYYNDIMNPPDKRWPAKDPELMVSFEDPMRQRVAVGEYGHAIGGPRMSEEDLQKVLSDHARMPNVDAYNDYGWRGRPEVQARLGQIESMHYGHPHIFPNLWIATGGAQLSLRLPKGPHKCEIWWFSLYEKELAPDEVRARLSQYLQIFGPAGMLEQDDGENWDQSTRGMSGLIAKRYPVNYQMGLNQKAVVTTERGVPYVDAPVNEYAQLWTWTCWADWMNAESWSALKAHKTPTPERL